VTEPRHSLINQSYNSKERKVPLNGDGFGLAWYNHRVSSEPALFKSISPAWNNDNLKELSRIIESGCIMAHVRAATQGLMVSESNCHPFKWKNYAFMHNGDIGGFHKIRRSLLSELSDLAIGQLKGTTDSEHFFALLIDELQELSNRESRDHLPSVMIKAIKKVLRLKKEKHVGEKSYMNMVLTDGNLAIAVRYTSDAPERADSLYLNQGRKYVCENGVCSMIDPGKSEEAIVISSEPLSVDSGWEPVPVNSLVVIQDGKIRDRKSITLTDL
jgi:predicted glutamine amidotransferase